MKMRFGQSLMLVAFVGLIIAMVLSAWSFMHSDQKWRQTYILLGQTGEIQSRAHKLQEKLTPITGYLQLAIKTGEESPRLETALIGLKTNIQELLSAAYLEAFLGKAEIGLLNSHRQMLEANYVPIDHQGKSYGAMLDDMAPVKENVSRILAEVTAKAQVLGEMVQIESHTSSYRWAFAFGAVLFLIAAIALFLAFFLLNARKDTSDPSPRSSPT
ncbi:MAG: hypothetical protein ACRECY_07850 [Phyllobacterium sp.]